MNKPKISKLLGYFDGPGSTPTHDPGLEVECAFCGKKLELPVKTTCMMWRVEPNKSFFYRVHKDCNEKLSEEEKQNLEGILLEMAEPREADNAE